MRDLSQCRTAALGGHLQQCDQCHYTQIAYNSCRNRHCPKCQATARAAWLERQAQNLLPVPYFHIVFTVPEQLNAMALQNQRRFYDLLFHAASETLLEIAADPRHLGAQIGLLAVLHTWGQTLQFHPHLHCVVPGGGISLDGRQWITSQPNFFLYVKVLSRLFRRKFLTALREAFVTNTLRLQGALAGLQSAHQFAAWLECLKNHEWVVYAKPPFGGPHQVLKYLARYTHRVAISNQRLVKFADGQVTFSYKDYAAKNVTRQMTLSALEFTRRFLLHVLPPGFVRIRHYGLLANRARQGKLALCRRLLQAAELQEFITARPSVESVAEEKPALGRCPRCQQGTMQRIEVTGIITCALRPGPGQARAPDQ